MRFKVIIIVLLANSSPMLFATETRVDGLGGVNELIIDNSNVKSFPALSTLYANEIMAEIKEPEVIGLIGLGKFGVLGIDVNADSLPTIINKTIDEMDINRGPDLSRFNVYYGKTISANSFGMKAGQYSFSWKKASTESSQNITASDVSLGIRYSVSENYALDVAGGIENFILNGKRDELAPDFDAKGKISHWEKARISSKINETCDFIIGMNYQNYNIDWTKTWEDTSIKGMKENMTTKNIEGYAGVVISPVPNTKVNFGLWAGKLDGDTLVNGDTTFSNTTTILPKIVIGIESKLNKWLIVRTGITKSWSNLETSEALTGGTSFNDATSREAPYTLSLGWGIKFDNFELDVISDDILFITPSIKLGATYRFSR